MTQESDLDMRLADEVTSLSTKLVTEVAKLLLLEETVVLLRREQAQLKTRVLVLESVESEHKRAREQLADLQLSNAALAEEKLAAEAKNKQLEGEVEDLTASLFNEANEMVLNASREAYNFKLKNRKLIEELAEKDAIIENLQAQLQDLKALFVKMDDQQRLASRIHTPRLEQGSFDFDSTAGGRDSTDLNGAGPVPVVLHQLLYGLRARAVRFDVPAYQLDFKAFVYQLIKPGFSFDLASLRALKYFRRLWTEELEPCVPVIPALTGNTFMKRWSKGKSFWNLLVEGRAIIEPVAGVNETFKLTYKGAKRGSEAPVALKDACAFCGENKDDLLEHARLYNLKLYGPNAETGPTEFGATETPSEPHTAIGTYPLCNFCLVKLRALCTFFASLRTIHCNIYKLPQNSMYDDIAYVNNFQFKRPSEAIQAPELDPDLEPVFVKLYLTLLVLRAKIFWSRVGFWDTDEDIEWLNVDEVPLDAFRTAVQDNVAFQHREKEILTLLLDATLASVDAEQGMACSERDSTLPTDAVKALDLVENSAYSNESKVDDAQKTRETPTETVQPDPDVLSKIDLNCGETAEPKAELQNEGLKTVYDDNDPRALDEEENQPILLGAEAEAEVKTTKGKAKKKKGKKGKKSTPVESAVIGSEEDEDGEFQDSSETLEGGAQLQRRESKSKKFKEKIDKDLDSTLAALQESLE